MLKTVSSSAVLHEVGGVPFGILEPVLTRCTPKQLFRIEECNPVNSALFCLWKHRGHEVSLSAFLAPFVRKILHRLFWLSLWCMYVFESSCHHQQSVLIGVLCEW